MRGRQIFMREAYADITAATFDVAARTAAAALAVI
jgi:hypothetical protein